MKFDTWEYEFLILEEELKYEKIIPVVISDTKEVFKTNNRYEFG